MSMIAAMYTSMTIGLADKYLVSLSYRLVDKAKTST
ncbi:hypothetical protein SHVI106290_14400 [Shewanella violacea]|uniref:Uncharacterized protein n=1 Tax=Shewanella violacea (strain JCM 10179 / CIP 106290 / LMG 19151 / DSS12) TaxID=637905 RepID=D4ZBR1_SHEVD|nr:hypothetical protein SVI_3485 [Shewanella violacea DSS12]